MISAPVGCVAAVMEIDLLVFYMRQNPQTLTGTVYLHTSLERYKSIILTYGRRIMCLHSGTCNNIHKNNIAVL